MRNPFVMRPTAQAELLRESKRSVKRGLIYETEPVIRAKAEAQSKKAAWAQYTEDKIQQRGEPVYPTSEYKFAGRRFVTEPNKRAVEFMNALGEYCLELAKYNQAHNTHIPPDTSLMQFPWLTEGREILAKHPVRRSEDERELPPLPLVGDIEPFDYESVKAKSSPGKPAPLSEAQASALYTREALAHYQFDIDKVLQSGQPFPQDPPNDTANQAMKLLQSLLIIGGATPSSSAELAIAARTQFHSLLLHRSRGLLASEMRTIFPLAGRDHLLAADDAGLKRQTDALAAIGLPSADNRGVSIDTLQAVLVKLGPDNVGVKSFFRQYDLTPGQKKTLLGLVSSQHRIEKETGEFNTQIKEINKKRAKGILPETKELQQVELWDRRVSALPKSAPKSAIPTVAAMTGAKIILDKTTDLTKPEELKAKVSKSVTEVSPKNDPSGADKAAADSAQGALDQVQTHIKDSPETTTLTAVALSSLAVADHIFKTLEAEGFNIEEFKADDFTREITQSIGRIPIPNLDEKGYYTNRFVREACNGLENDLNSADLTRRAKAQSMVTQAGTLGNALFLALTEAGAPSVDAVIVAEDVVRHFCRTGKIDETLITERMNYVRLDINAIKPASIHQAGELALLITQGVKASRDSVANTKIEAIDKIKKAGIPEGVAKNIANQIHDRHLNDPPINDTIVKNTIKQEIKLSNHAIAAICDPDLADFEFEGEIEEGEENLRTALIEIAEYYKAHGDINAEKVAEILTSHISEDDAEALAPAREGQAFLDDEEAPTSINLMTTTIMARKDRGVGGDPNRVLPGVTPNEPRIPMPLDSDIHDASIQVKALYDDIPNKAAQAGAGKVAQLTTGAQENDVRTEVEKARKAGKDFVQAAEAGAKKLPSGKGPVARLALTALVGKEHDAPVERENALRDVNSESKPALPKATAFAIGAGIGAVAAGAGFAGFGKPITNVVVGEILTRNSFDEKRVKDSIEAKLNTVQGNVEKIIYFAADPNSLGLHDQNPSQGLLNDIRDKLVAHYLKNGEISDDNALKIVNQAITDENATNHPVPPIRHSALCQNFDNIETQLLLAGFPPLPANFHPDFEAAKPRLFYEIQKAYIMTAGIQAIQNVETSHPQADQDSKTQNFREVAAVVVPVAMDNGCTQEEAIKLAERFTKFYVEKEGKLDGLKLDEVKNYIEQAKPGTVDPALTKTAKMLLRAVHSTAKLLPKDQGMGGVAAGTTVASDIFPTLKKSPAAGATAALIEQVRGSEGVDISRATAYVEGLASITPSMTPFSAIAASGIAARRRLVNNSPLRAARFAREAFINVEARGVGYDALPLGFIRTVAEGSFQTVNDIVLILIEEDPQRAPELMQQASVMGAYIGATGARLGISPEQTKAVALTLTSPQIMQLGRSALKPAVQAGLDLARVESSQQVMRAINGLYNPSVPVGARVADFDNRINTAIVNGIAAGQAQLRGAHPDIKVAANLVYSTAKTQFLHGIPLDTMSKAQKQYFEKAAEAVGNQAAAKFSHETLKTGTYPIEEVSKQMHSYTNFAVKATESFKAQAEKLTGPGTLVDDAYKIPAKVDELTVAQLTDSAWMGELVHTGLQAGETADITDAKPGEEKEIKAAAAAEAIARKSGVTDPEKLKEIREIAKKAVQDGETPAVIGALIAARIPGSPPEVAHAYAVTVTELTLDPHASEQEKSLALAEAASSAAIGEDRALPTAPDKEVELREVANDERVRREKAAKAANDDRLRSELRKLPEDETGVTTATKTLETMVIDVHGIELTLPTYGTDHHGPQLLSEVPGCEQIFEDLKSCGKFVDSETLEQAIAAINARYGLQLKVTGHGTGTVRADLTGMSPGRIGELMQEWVKTSKAKQAKAVVAKNDQAVKQHIAQTNSMRVGRWGLMISARALETLPSLAGRSSAAAISHNL